MNKKIYAKLVQLTNEAQLKDLLIDAILSKADDKILRFIDLMYDEDIRMCDLEPVTLSYNDIPCTLVSLDYLNDEIEYSYRDTRKKYFATQEDADKYAETGDYNYNKTSYNYTDEYCIESKHTFVETGHCTITDWQTRRTPKAIENGTAN